jgi:hypothetical protein
LYENDESTHPAHHSGRYVPPVKSELAGKGGGEAEFRHGPGLLSSFGEATLVL